MQLLFNVPPEPIGVPAGAAFCAGVPSPRSWPGRSIPWQRLFADDVPILANRRVQAGK